MNYKSKIMLFTLFLFYGFTQLLFAQQVSWYSKDMGFTSPEHKKNVKKIIWSKSVIPWNKVANAKLETRFKLTDPIYGRIFLQRSIRNTPIDPLLIKNPLKIQRIVMSLNYILTTKILVVVLVFFMMLIL